MGVLAPFIRSASCFNFKSCERHNNKGVVIAQRYPSARRIPLVTPTLCQFTTPHFRTEKRYRGGPSFSAATKSSKHLYEDCIIPGIPSIALLGWELAATPSEIRENRIARRKYFQRGAKYSYRTCANQRSNGI